MLSRLCVLLLTLWAGSLWAVCGIVAPTLFALLDDRRIAGQLATRFFLIETWMGALIAGALLVLSLTRKLVLPARTWIATAAALPLFSHLAIGPLMSRARAAGDMAQFAWLHGVSAACFLAAAVCLAVAVWKINRPAE